MTFDLYAQQDIAREPQLVTLHDLKHPIKGPPGLWVVPADEQNQGWIDQVLLDAQAEPDAIGAQRQFDPRAEAQALERLRARLAKHVVKRIHNVWKDPAGTVPAHETDDLVEFVMRGIPKFVIIKLRRYVENSTNFQRTLDELAQPPASTIQALAGK